VEQSSGCCTSTRQTDDPEAPETDPLKCFSIAYWKKWAPCPPHHLSLAAEEHQRTLVMTVKDMKEFLLCPDLKLLLHVSSVVFQLKKAKQQYSVWKNS